MGIQNRACQNQMAHNNELHEKFMYHIEQEGLNFGTKEEFLFRFDLFQQMDQEIERINAENSSFTVGHNMFSTMTQAEKKKMLGYAGKPATMKEPKHFDDLNIPTSVDWRTAGGVNPVKNQAHCGSCWAFSATCANEHAHWRATKNLVSLSEEQLVQCSTVNHGCNGGW